MSNSNCDTADGWAARWRKAKNGHVPYEPRFIREADVPELMNLWHLSRVSLSGTSGGAMRYKRMLWAAGQFSKLHPEVTPTGAYKDLDGLLE